MELFTLYPFYADIKIEGNKIQFFEKQDNFTRIRFENKKIESDQLFIYPGFRDTHGHIYSLGKLKSTIDLTLTKGFEEVIDILKKSKIKSNDWIIARGWNNENWTDKSLPNNILLNKFFPNTPVYIVRVDGHCALANQKALEIAKINENTENPEGGEIQKDHQGNLTGILLDNAMNIVSKRLPQSTHQNKVDFIKRGMKELSKYGIIETHDMDVHPELAKIFFSLDTKNELSLYIKSYISAQNDEYIKYHIKKYKGNFFEIAGIKLYADGALGSRGAFLESEYSDDKDNYGLELLKYKELLEKVKIAIKNKMDVAIHCIGDQANINVTRVYSELKDKRDNLEFRIEHAQILNSYLPELFKQYEITLSIQPIHCISDAFMADKRLDKRVKTSYLWKTLLEKGNKVLPGSDYPIESPNPLFGIDAFVNRIPFNSDAPWNSEERIGLQNALDLYYSDISIKDIRNNFIILDNNLFKIDSKEISKVSNKFTLFNGFVSYNGLI